MTVSVRRNVFLFGVVASGDLILRGDPADFQAPTQSRPRAVLRTAIAGYLTRYNAERPHQGIGNVPLTGDAKTPKNGKGRINCRKRLGGLIRHYHRSAA